MSDDFDDLLHDAAETYRVPPEPPREAMWEAIQRARAERTVTPISVARRAPRWLAASAGIAAVLLLGIAIGRGTKSTVPDRAVAEVNRTPRPHVDSAIPGVDAGAPTDNALASAPSPETEDVAAPTAGRSSSAIQRIATARDRNRALAERATVAGDLASDQSAYRLAIIEHLARTEVLLTGFRAQSHPVGEARLDAQFASMCKELLGTTRLLLATRHGDDPTITRLLQDLELVLMELSQYATDGRRIDLDAFNQSLDRRNVIPKLRSNIPAGVSTSSGT